MGWKPSRNEKQLHKEVMVPSKKRHCTPLTSQQPISEPAQTLDEFKIKSSSFMGLYLGSIYENYRVGKRIGFGSIGVVSEAIGRKTNIIRAVKSIQKSELNRNIYDKERFSNEVEILKKVDHPNILKLYEVYEDQRYIHLVTEMCKGGELFDYILEEKKWTESTTAHFMKQIFQAISYWHSIGIVHRDLKPENLLMEDHTGTSSIKVIDFSTSALIDPQKMLTQKLGTPYYTAPEILKGDYNEKIDWWSCGSIMYIMLCGYPPFNGSSDKEILHNVLRGKYEFPDAEWSGISADAKDLINKLLTLKASKRISMAEALEHSWITSREPQEELKTQHVFMLENLQNFHAEAKLQRAVMTFIVSQLINEQDKNELISVFKALDTNNDGKLSEQELITGYSKLYGSSDSIQQEVEDIMSKADSDGNGYIEYTEFVVATIDKKKLLSKENVQATFQAFDKDKRGCISISELSQMLGPQSLREDLWKELLKEVNQDTNGTVDINDFVNMMLKIF